MTQPLAFLASISCAPVMRCHSVGLWYEQVPDAIGYAKHRSPSRRAVIRVYDETGNVIETHEHKGDFKEPWKLHRNQRDSFSNIIAVRSKMGLTVLLLTVRSPS